MNEEKKIERFIASNYKAIIGLFVYIVIGYAGYKEVQNQVETNKRRLQTYINEHKQSKKEINNLKVEIAMLKERSKNCK